MPASESFLFNFLTAFNAQLVEAFDGLSDVPLTAANLAVLPPGRGVYRLHHPRPDVVYVGKADDLPTRLIRHMRKLDGRIGMAAATVGFTCLYIEDSLMTASPEGVLIRHYKNAVGLNWDRSGFGSNDPGRKRDRQAPGAFDAAFPIDLSAASGIPAGTYTANDLIARLQMGRGQPYVTRVDEEADAMADRAVAQVTLKGGLTIEQTAEELIASLRAVSAPGTLPWNGAALLGAIVLYKTTEPYPFNLRTF